MVEEIIQEVPEKEKLPEMSIRELEQELRSHIDGLTKQKVITLQSAVNALMNIYLGTLAAFMDPEAVMKTLEDHVISIKKSFEQSKATEEVVVEPKAE